MTANKTDEAIDATKPIDTDECVDEYTIQIRTTLLFNFTE